MTSVAQVERTLKHILEERANVLARETGCIERQRKFSGADLLQTLVFGWLSHPDASLETLTSMAATREVYVTDTALDHRFTKECAQFLHAILQEMTSVVIEADRDVPLDVLCRFEAVILEDSSSIALPDESSLDLARMRWSAWRGASRRQSACPLGTQTRTAARAALDSWADQRPFESVQRRSLACWELVYRRSRICGLGQRGPTASSGELHAHPCSRPNALLDP